jgi:hypothetical protein
MIYPNMASDSLAWRVSFALVMSVPCALLVVILSRLPLDFPLDCGPSRGNEIEFDFADETTAQLVRRLKSFGGTANDYKEAVCRLHHETMIMSNQLGHAYCGDRCFRTEDEKEMHCHQLCSWKKRQRQREREEEEEAAAAAHEDADSEGIGSQDGSCSDAEWEFTKRWAN